MDILQQFIPVARAQGLNALAQPTFGPLNITGSGSTNQNVQLLLKVAENKAPVVAVGSSIKLNLELKTGTTISLTEYQVVITYDPQKLSVVDQDALITGTQIKFLHSLFTVVAPEQDNNKTDSAAGKITLRASGQFPVTVNNNILEITFQGQRVGTTQVSIDTTPIDGTRLKRSGTDIPFNSSSLNIQIDQTGQTASCTQNSQCSNGQVCLSSGICGPSQAIACTSSASCPANQLCSGGFCVDAGVACTSNSQCTGGQVCLQGACTAPLPQTALVDDIASAGILIMAIGLVVFGVYLRIKSYARN